MPPSAYLARTLRIAAVLALYGALPVPAAAQGNGPVRIGFLVQQARQPDCQDEWRFAEQAAQDKGVALLKVALAPGAALRAAVQALSAQGAQGLIVCGPEGALGGTLLRSAGNGGLKVMAMNEAAPDSAAPAPAAPPNVARMRASDYQVGLQVGQALVREIRARGWSMAEIGALRLSQDQAPSARERCRGVATILRAAGLPPANMVDAPVGKGEGDGDAVYTAAFHAADAALAARPERLRHWLAFGMNDDIVLGAVRAAEKHGLHGDGLIGIGIGGGKPALDEFSRPVPTGFFGTILIGPRRDGYESTLLMMKWIKEDHVPPDFRLGGGTLMTRTNLASLRAQYGL